MLHQQICTFERTAPFFFNGGKEKLYVVTREQKNSNPECFIFDTKGTFIKKAFLPINIFLPGTFFSEKIRPT